MFIFIFHHTSELCNENVKRSTTIETQKDNGSSGANAKGRQVLY